MTPLIQLKKAAPVFHVALVCFGLLPKTQAVSPAPDGGYPGGNTAEGQNALFSLTTGGFNTAVGFLSLRSNTTGGLNTAIGAGALFANTGFNNTATGAEALLSNTTGFGNTANGFQALSSNTTGSANTAIGNAALFSNTTGQDNVAIGGLALLHATGSSNTAVGEGALVNNTTGNGNTSLGLAGCGNVTTASLVTCINASGANVSFTTYIGNIRGITTQNNDAIPVLIDSNDQLGTMSSSRRFKKEIKPMDQASAAILALKPVTFHYKSDKTNRPEFGLIAEEVAAVNSNLVVRDKDGKPYTVRYDAVNAMLLNEFLKEHRKVQELEKQVEKLTAGLQKVSDQLELSKSAPQTALNH